MSLTVKYFEAGYSFGRKGHKVKDFDGVSYPETFLQGVAQGAADRFWLRTLELTGLVAVVLFLVWVGVNSV